MRAKPSIREGRIYFMIGYDRDDFDGYCSYIKKIIPEEQAEQYRERIFKELMIGVLRVFDIEKMKKQRFLYNLT